MSGTLYRDLSGNNVGGGVDLNNPDARAQESVDSRLLDEDLNVVPLQAGAPYVIETNVGANAANIKASAAIFDGVKATNTDAVNKKIIYIYNKATAPTFGTDVPLDSFEIPAGATVEYDPPFSLRCSSGLGIAFAKADGITAAANGELTHVTVYYR